MPQPVMIDGMRATTNLVAEPFANDGAKRWRAFNTVVVEHPILEDTLGKVIKILGLAGDSVGRVPCMQVTGPSGVGKSTLFEMLRAAYPVTLSANVARHRNGTTHTANHVPVVCVEMPTKPNVLELARRMLLVLGDPLWFKGTRAELEHRVDVFIAACGTRGLVIDEGQRLVDKAGKLTAADVVDWLKERHAKCSVCIVMIGLPWTQHLMGGDTQYLHRFDAEVKMKPYEWGIDAEDGSEPKGRINFLALLSSFQRSIPIPFAKELAIGDDSEVTDQDYDAWRTQQDDVAKRFFYACQGLAGGLKKLLAMAMRESENKEVVDMALLATAFEGAIGTESSLVRLVNPFTKAWEGELPPAIPDLSVGPYRERAHKRRATRGRDTKGQRRRALRDALTKG